MRSPLPRETGTGDSHEDAALNGHRKWMAPRMAASSIPRSPRLNRISSKPSRHWSMLNVFFHLPPKWNASPFSNIPHGTIVGFQKKDEPVLSCRNVAHRWRTFSYAAGVDLGRVPGSLRGLIQRGSRGLPGRLRYGRTFCADHGCATGVTSALLTSLSWRLLF